MKTNYRLLTKLCSSVLFISLNFISNAQVTSSNKSAIASCDNEDFEVSTGGLITATAGITGWNTFKLVPPISPYVDNCSLLTSTAVTRVAPTAVYLFTTNGHIDTLIGATYPIYSVFGDGLPNGGNAFDPSLPTMYGSNFIRLGDASGTGYNHHTIEKSFLVTSTNALFRFAYISVAKTGSSCCDAPSVQVKFFNTSQGNALLGCPSYSVNAPMFGCANNSMPMTATTNTSFGALTTYYHKWKIQAVDLSPYIGSTIKFMMGVTYCSNGCAKYAYSYLDAQCSAMEVYVNGTPFPITTNSVNFSGCGITSATVVAPPDFSSYQWAGPAGFTSTLSTITTTASGVYTLTILTSGTCSTLTKYISIGLYPAPTVSLSTSNTQLCIGKSAKLTASGLTSYTWNAQPGIATLNITPTITTTYTVSGTDNNGC